MDRAERSAELQRLKSRIAELEADSEREEISPGEWPPAGYYTAYHLMAGMVLGLIAAAASLLFNVVGSALFGKHPLELIRAYLTFPMGESALTLENGFAMAAGCCLYLGTGMIGGIPFHMILSRFFAEASWTTRFAVSTVLGIGVWIVNFYLVLSWLQPMLVGGSWIIQQVPVWVAISTHLVFGWTMFAVDHWGRFVPYRKKLPEVSQT